MYGVILWSDPCVRKAVIWCEDEGSLAYYEAPETFVHSDEMFFDTGDYVEFDVTMDNELARAQNAQIVMSARPTPLSRNFPGFNATSRGRTAVPFAQSGQDLEAQVIQLADHRATPRPQTKEVNRRG